MVCRHRQLVIAEHQRSPKVRKPCAEGGLYESR